MIGILIRNLKPSQVIVVLTLLALAFLVGWRLWQSQGSGTPAGRGGGGRRGGGRSVLVDAASLQTVQFEYEVVGNVESLQTVDIVARTAGILEQVNVIQGDEVSRGQLLAKIDESQVLNEVYKARSALANAEFTYFQLLNQQNLTDVQAGSGIATAQADVQAARANFERSEAVYAATLTQGETSVAQAEATHAGAKAQLRQAVVDYGQSKVHYERMLGLQAQGFASFADVQDAYAAVQSRYAAVQAQEAMVSAASSEVTNAKERAQADAISAKAEIETSRLTEVSSQATLSEAQAGTSRTVAFQQQVLAQKSLVEAAEAELRLAELALADTNLRSPVDGFVSDRRLDPGAVTSIGTVVLTVQAAGEVRVVASLPQEIYRYIQPGRRCLVRIDGLGGQAFEASVATKDSAVDPASRQFNVRIQLQDEEGLVRPGMFARVQFFLGPQEPRLTVPSGALQNKNSTDNTATVYLVQDGVVEVRQVEYGLSDEANTLIRSGLEEGDVVVVRSPGSLASGQEVQVEQAGPAEQEGEGQEETLSTSASPTPPLDGGP